MCEAVVCEGSQCSIDEFELAVRPTVIAVGATTLPFGVPGVREHCLFLKQIFDADSLRKALGNAFERASLPTLSADERRRALSFCARRRGSTGVGPVVSYEIFWQRTRRGTTPTSLVKRESRYSRRRTRSWAPSTLAKSRGPVASSESEGSRRTTRTSPASTSSSAPRSRRSTGRTFYWAKRTVPHGLGGLTGNGCRRVGRVRDGVGPFGEGAQARPRPKHEGGWPWTPGFACWERRAARGSAAGRLALRRAAFAGHGPRSRRNKASTSPVCCGARAATYLGAVETVRAGGRRLDELFCETEGDAVVARPFQFLNLGILAYVGDSKALAQVSLGDSTLADTGRPRVRALAAAAHGEAGVAAEPRARRGRLGAGPRLRAGHYALLGSGLALYRIVHRLTILSHADVVRIIHIRKRPRVVAELEDSDAPPSVAVGGVARGRALVERGTAPRSARGA